MSRQYTEAERTEARALAAVMGAKKAAAQTGIPRRTISYWLRQPTASPIIKAVEIDAANLLRGLWAESVAVARAKVLDPKTTAGELAQLIRVVGEQLALAEGRATSNIEQHVFTNAPHVEREAPLDDAERFDLSAYLDGLLDGPDENLAAMAEGIRADNAALVTRRDASVIRDSAYLKRGNTRSGPWPPDAAEDG